MFHAAMQSASHIYGSFAQQRKSISHICGSFMQQRKALPTFAEASRSDAKRFQHLRKLRPATQSVSNICGSFAHDCKTLSTNEKSTSHQHEVLFLLYIALCRIFRGWRRILGLPFLLQTATSLQRIGQYPLYLAVDGAKFVFCPRLDSIHSGTIHTQYKAFGRSFFLGHSYLNDK